MFANNDNLPIACITLEVMPLHAQRSTSQRSAAQHSTAQHSTAQHSTAQHSTAQHGTARHSTAWHTYAFYVNDLQNKYFACDNTYMAVSPQAV